MNAVVMKHIVRRIPIIVIMDVIVVKVIVGCRPSGFAGQRKTMIIIVEFIVIDLVVGIAGVIAVVHRPADIVKNVVVHSPVTAADREAVIAVHVVQIIGRGVNINIPND